MVSVVETLNEALDNSAAVDLDTLTDGESDAELVALVRLRTPPRCRTGPPRRPLGPVGGVALRRVPGPVGPAVPHHQPVTGRRPTDPPPRP